MARAVVQAVAWYGAGWYCNPMWPSPDHVVPYRMFWVWWEGIQVGRAWDRLDMGQAASLPQMDAKDRQRVVNDLMASAFGGSR